MRQLLGCGPNPRICLAVGHAPPQHLEQARDDLANTILIEACIIAFLDPDPFYRVQAMLGLFKILR